MLWLYYWWFGYNTCNECKSRLWRTILYRESIFKNKRCKKNDRNIKKDILLEVDGGVKTSNVDKVLQSGANLIVSGSDVFNHDIESQLDIYNQKL